MLKLKCFLFWLLLVPIYVTNVNAMVMNISLTVAKAGSTHVGELRGVV